MGKDCGPRGKGHGHFQEQEKSSRMRHPLLKFTSGPLEKTQNSHKEGVDLDVLPAGLLTDLVEVFEAPPIISLD